MDTYGLLNNNTGLLNGFAEGIKNGLEGFKNERDRKDRINEKESDRAQKELELRRVQEQHNLLFSKQRQAHQEDMAAGLENAKKLAQFKAGLDKKGLLAGMTPGQTAVDKAYAKKYEENVLEGGNAVAERNIGQVERGLEDLKTGRVKTGGMFSSLPDSVRDYLDPTAKANQDTIRQAVMGSLKSTLGAQFTEREGQKIFDLAYNPRQSTEENMQRVGDLLTEIKSQYGSKKGAQQEYENKGTLREYKGPQVDINALYAKARGDKPPASGLIKEAAAGEPSPKEDESAARQKRIQELRAKLGK